PSKPVPGVRSGGSGSGGGLGAMTMTSKNQPIATLVRNLQSHFDKPILDRTGLTGNYDGALAVIWDDGTSQSDAIMQTLPVQLGLALTPGREPLDLLIVEANKAY